jgi:hypothetical protein
LASEPYPLFYGDQAGVELKQPTPLLAELGLPLTIEENSPEKARIEVVRGQTILKSVPFRFAFPPGEPQARAGRISQENATFGMAVNDRDGVALRAGQPSQYDSADHYLSLLTVVDGRGENRGDVAFYVELGAGPGHGGKVLYLWSTLLSSPQGDAVMGDTVSWVLHKSIRGY